MLNHFQFVAYSRYFFTPAFPPLQDHTDISTPPFSATSPVTTAASAGPTADHIALQPTTKARTQVILRLLRLDFVVFNILTRTVVKGQYGPIL